MGNNVTVETNLLNIPASIIKTEISGLYGTNVLQDMHEVIELYKVYESGADYARDSNMDYTPADLRYKTLEH